MRHFIATIMFVLCLIPIDATAQDKGPTGENIALGKKYTFSVAPNYRYCTDPDDIIQLTDGKTTKEYFWTQKGTVGWDGVGTVSITIDLGKLEPIDRIAFTSAAGAAGVSWPICAIALVSEDGKTFYETSGDFLLYEQERNGVFNNDKYSIRKLSSGPLATKGRFVRLFIFSSGSFTFTDEIEIFRGDDCNLKRAYGKEASEDIKEYGNIMRFESALKKRYLADVEEIRNMILSSAKSGHLNELKKNLFEQRVNSLRTRLFEQAPPDAKKLRTIFPLNSGHAELLAIQAKLWKAAGAAPLTAEVVNRWEMFPLIGRFPTSVTTTAIDMLRGESRPFAVNLYNAEDETVQVTATASTKGTGPKVSFARIPWTDTNLLVPVQAAIMELAVKNGKSESVDVLPGIPCQFWITFDSTGVAAGNYPFDVTLESNSGTKIVVKATVTVHPADMPAKPSLLVGGWDYTDGLPAYNVTEKNIDSFMEVCRNHYVNAPWAQSRTMFKCTLTGNPKKLSVDTKIMEKWLERWPDAKEYFVFLSVGNSFLGFQRGTPEFDHWVGEWAKFWGEWLKERKIDPSRFSLLVHDEPGLHAKEDVIAKICQWSRAISKSNSGLRVWEDPVYINPASSPAELYEVSDTLCPNRPQWLAHPKAFEKFYLDQQKKGKMLHLYSCSGPFRLLDPYHYCLLQAWHCFQIDAKASFFWALGDGRRASCWNEYLLLGHAFCPMFIDPEDPKVYSAKQMAAIKESVQDYETLRLLQGAIENAKAKGVPADKVEHAQRVLKEGVTEVLSTPRSDKIEWKEPGKRATADLVRSRMIKELVELTK